VGLALIAYPALVRLSGERFPQTQYQFGRAPSLYRFFLEQPKDIVLASLTQEANFLPTFSRRSIVVGREYAIPLNVGYYRQIRERAMDLLRAQYAADVSEVAEVIQKYGVDFWLLEQSSFRAGYIASRDWLRQFQPTAAQAQARLERGELPALAKLAERCAVVAVDGHQVLEGRCILSAAQLGAPAVASFAR
jgi:hypothetical protein